MAQVFKIQFDNTLRRISVPICDHGDLEGFTYKDLEVKVRELFQIPNASRVVLTYIDSEGDAIMLADDQDLRDACLAQALNPLRLAVKEVALKEGPEAKGSESRPKTTEFDVEALLKGLFPESTAKAIDQVLSQYPPYLFATVPAHVLPKALDTFLETLAAESMDGKFKSQRVLPPHVALHKNIECDHCFTCPIVGPRYQSTKKFDYDLCSDCFTKVGNATDYRKLDRPVTAIPSTKRGQVFSMPSKKDWRPSGKVFLSAPLRDIKGANSTSGLDAEFLWDVNILDGSKIEVGTPFTKIWRFKNCGMLPWPQHTQLIHTGGPTLGSTNVVTLKLPEGGLPSGSEFDVSIELLAPGKSGLYLSNWSLASPAGQRFGHSVWVLIEAIPACKENESVSVETDIDNGAQALLHEEVKIGHSHLQAEFTECEGVTDLQSGEAVHKAAALELKPTEQYVEMDGFSLVERVYIENIEDHECLTATEGFEMVGSFSEELASQDLVSKQNDTKIKATQALPSEDNCLASTGWDHMLKELEELGFCDTRMNKELLLKTEGSIKRAVKELVELERQAFAGKIKAA